MPPKFIGWALVVLASVCFVASVAFVCLSIWTVGPDAGRWSSMSGLGFMVCLIFAVFGAWVVSEGD